MLPDCNAVPRFCKACCSGSVVEVVLVAEAKPAASVVGEVDVAVEEVGGSA